MARSRYDKGLKDLGNGVYAYMQPDGSWGWSNAGLIVDGDESMLVDTLFDLDLTREMLAAMRGATRAAANIECLVNTHANGDHCWGNELVEGAEIIASRASAEEMEEVPAAMLAQMMKAAPQMGELGDYMKRIFGAFDFEGIKTTLPTRTFDRELTVSVGDRTVELIEVGPAHTKGDVLVHVPSDRTVFTGDILFIEGHPIMWAGPVANWIRACERILAMDVETIVPGHGPITDKAGVAAVQGYLEYVSAEARKRFDAGMSSFEAAQDIALDDYSSWGDGERIAVNVDTLYREFSGSTAPPNIVELFGRMARLAR
ncbi:MBL fold metallo-hydrolase [Oceanibacterium hippocampi]|uniref:Hydroxyacylglutathione hydrolase n=1 Tax=Oceanibacterium hippocampi TaxID=745714 RepID=A0A1Y5U3H5_9PROT|nr:MBL fold metallo-hydrolase [Oceanibacterium hippocampi]SLN76301.1 Hydroxyacylglutathione hydrolase [Oceanibacterium hippocampi]